MSAPRVEFADQKGRVWRLALLAVMFCLSAALAHFAFSRPLMR